MSKQTTWKAAERQLATILCKYKIPAKRKSQRQENYAISIDDVGIEGADWIKLDAKYRKSGFAVNTLLDVVEKKYARLPNEIGIVGLKGGGQHGMRFLLDDEFGAMLLSYWLGHATKEELWAIYNGK